MPARRLALAAALFALSAAAPGESPRPLQPELTYADLADLALAAPLVAHVRVADSILLKKEQAATVPAGLARYYVQADVLSLIRGPDGVPPRISYLVDLPRDAKGKAPKLRKDTQFILLAAPVPGRPGEVRLVAPDAQLAFAPARAERLRAILTEAAAAGAAPRITGIGRAFHVPGALPGESETQIFLQTAGGNPVSLNVLRRPGETPLWAVALSEIVDQAAEPPARDTLLWYRLACSLPRGLPPQSIAGDEHAAQIQADYRLVMEGLGPCPRTRSRS